MPYIDAFKKKIDNFNASGLKISLDLKCHGTISSTICISMQGELDNENSPELKDLLAHIFDESELPSKIILECSGLTYVSSTGIGAIVFFLMECKKQNVQLFLAGVPVKVKDIFSLLGFDSYFTFIESPKDI
ncbi:MAG: STAS domain-containing protein [Spirochaetaceae bacterium]